MKKRAFVRYSKQGKIVPGSLILTGGSYPNGPATWNEIPADLCCPLSTPSTLLSNEVSNGEGIYCVEGVGISCNDVTILFYPVFDLFNVSLENLILGLNTQLGNLGTWVAVSSTEVGVNVSDSFLNTLCPSGTITINFSCGG